MAEPKTIYCPSCGRVACHYDGKQINNPMAKCKKCRKLIVYNVATGETEIKPIPPRNCSSGMTFC